VKFTQGSLAGGARLASNLLRPAGRPGHLGRNLRRGHAHGGDVAFAMPFGHCGQTDALPAPPAEPLG